MKRMNTASSPSMYVGTPNTAYWSTASVCSAARVFSGRPLHDLGLDRVGVEADPLDRRLRARPRGRAAARGRGAARTARRARRGTGRGTGRGPRCRRASASVPVPHSLGSRSHTGGSPSSTWAWSSEKAWKRTSRSAPSRSALTSGLVAVAGERAAVVEGQARSERGIGAPQLGDMARSTERDPDLAGHSGSGGSVPADCRPSRCRRVAERERRPRRRRRRRRRGASARRPGCRRRPPRARTRTVAVRRSREQDRRRGERRGRVARRERRRDRPAHAVGQRALGDLVLGPDPAEQRLDRAVGERGLDAHRRGELGPRTAGRRGCTDRHAADAEPQQAVIGRARQRVHDARRAPGCGASSRRRPRGRTPDRRNSSGSEPKAGPSEARALRGGRGERQRAAAITVPGPAQLRGLQRVAAERRAVRLVAAVVAERPGCGRKSSRAHDDWIAFHSAWVLRATPVTDCSDGLAMIASGFER